MLSLGEAVSFIAELFSIFEPMTLGGLDSSLGILILAFMVCSPLSTSMLGFKYF
jgi:hypothetical protein